MATYTTSGLGWTAGTDVTSQMNTFLASTIAAGDTLTVDGFYTLDHRAVDGDNMDIPANVQMLAGAPGDGFDILTEGTKSSPVFRPQSNFLLDNMTFSYPLAPNTGYGGANPANGTDYHGAILFSASGSGHIFRRSSFTGQVNMHLNLSNTPNVLIEQCLFDGGFYQTRQVGDSDYLVYRYNHCRNGVGDGLKTTRNSSAPPGPRYQLVEHCLFQDMNRDGLDTTGGFKQAVVNDCIFWNLGVAGCDFKAIYENPNDSHPEVTNSNGIRLNRCQFVDINNSVVITTLDRYNPLLIQNSDDALQYMPNDIVMTNCVTESTTGVNKKQVLLKDGYNVHWVDSEFYGTIKDVNILNDLGVPGWSAFDVNGTVAVEDPNPRGLAVTDLWNYSIGPGSALISAPAAPKIPKMLRVAGLVLPI